MKLKITILFLVFIFQTVYSQSSHFAVETTAPFKDIKSGSTLLNVHQVDSQNTILVRTIKKDFVISMFDDAHKLTANIELEKEKKESFIGSVLTKDLLRVFTTNKIDKKTEGIYCRTFNPISKKVTKKLLFKVDKERKRGFYLGGFTLSSPRGQEQQFRVSPNGEYIVFTNSVYSKKTSSSSIHVYDINLDEIFTTEYFNEAKTYYSPDDFIVTDNAEVIIAGKAYIKGDKEKVKGKANYEYEIHKISELSNSKKEIQLADYFIQELRFAQNNDQLRLLGFYSEKSSYSMKGVISYVFNATNIQDVNLKTSAFPEIVYDDIYGKKKAERKKKKEKEFGQYYLDYSLVDSEGNGYLTAEQFYITTHTFANANGGFTTQTYTHYDNILAAKVDSEGNLLWARNILKSASTHSYNAFDLNGKLHILLNTGKNITEKSNNRKQVRKSWFEKSALYDIVYDENGEETYELIKENDGKKDFFSPTRGSYDYDQFIMANFSKKKRQFLILKEK